MQGLIFEWDPAKAKANFEKHGITFEEGMTIFDDENAITIYDYSHSKDEDRFVDFRFSKEWKHTERCLY